jgi:hypothetical protein
VLLGPASASPTGATTTIAVSARDWPLASLSTASLIRRVPKGVPPGTLTRNQAASAALARRLLRFQVTTLPFSPPGEAATKVMPAGTSRSAPRPGRRTGRSRCRPAGS